MIRQFFKDSALYGLSVILARAISLIMLPIFTQYLTPVEYGRIDILTVFGAVMGVLICLEISQGVARYYTDTKNESMRKSYASTSLTFTFSAYLFLAISCFIYDDVLSQWLFEDSSETSIIRWGVLQISIFGLSSLILAQLRWDHKPVPFVFVNFMQTLCSVVCSYYLVVNMRLGIEGMLQGLVFGGVVSTMLGLYFTRKIFKFQLDIENLKDMLSFSLPLVPAALGTLFAAYIDRVAIKELLGLADLGIYGIAYRFASLGSVLIFGFQMALTPLVYKHYKEPKTPRRLADITRYFLALLFPVICLSGLFSDLLLRVFAADAFFGASQVLALLLVAVVASKMYVFAPGLAIAKKTKYIAIITIIGGLINILLNQALIPVLGIVGAALATLVGALCTLSGWVFLSNRYYPIPYQWRVFTFSALITLTVLFLDVYIVNLGISSLYLKIALFLAALCGFVFIKLLSLDEMRRVVYSLKGS